MEASAAAVLDLAWSRGVRYFDAARSYGRAEAFLAAWLGSRGIEPGPVAIGSKWGYTYTADWKVEADRHEVKDHSLATLRRQVLETREILGATWTSTRSTPRPSRAASSTTGRCWRSWPDSGPRPAGRSACRRPGPAQGATIREALAIEVDGVRLFDSVQATWNLLEPSTGPALAEAREAGLGVIVKEAMANGRLAGRNIDPAFAPRRAALEAEAARLGTTLDALALAAALARPWADVVLSGASTGDQLRSNLEGPAVPWDDRAEETLRTLAEPPEGYWATRARLPWN